MTAFPPTPSGPQSTPRPQLEVRHDHTSGLPDDILEDARKRLAWACFIYAGAFLMADFIPRWVGLSRSPFERSHTLEDTVGLASITLAVALAAALRWRRLPTLLMLDLGLVFEFVGAVGISISETWSFYEPRHLAMHQYAHGISWVAVWVIVFPTLVPTRLGRTLLAVLASIASGPIILQASYITNHPEITSQNHHANLLGLAIGNAIAGTMAVVCSRIIHKLSRNVGEARQVGSYQLEERMGAGGMGEVWRAKHRLLVRPAAVKLIRPEALLGLRATTPERVLRRFEREAQATAQLECPHSVQVYDFGITKDGTFFYVMELLNGLDLETLVTRFGPQPAERVVHLLAQACHSLGEAHQRGLLHRDVKPANIFCCRYGLDFDFVKVLDFGLVKAFGEANDPDQSKLTAEGHVTGTPAFMAPEALLGDSALDARTDLYALGCVAYWLLTGRMVFDAPSPMKLALMHVEAPPTPPSHFSEVPIPQALDQLVLELLSKRQDDRPPTALDVMRRLQECPLERPWDGERARTWWIKHLPDRGPSSPPPLALAGTEALTPVPTTQPE